ncbi:MAG: RagB/SusD family nutrient uptake outer membrane protein [Chitinophagaceae bacterium]
MKNVIFIVMAFLVALVTSCEKAIETTPVSTITATSFWTKQDDVTGGLRGMYLQLRGSSTSAGATSDLYFLGEGRSDILTSATAGTTGLDKYYNNTLNVGNPGPNWIQFYSAINAANLVLKYTPGITFSSADAKNSALAQAYTMRAFVYFVLARSWGGVPIRTDPLESYDPATIQIARSSVEDVFKLIKSDLDQALTLYPTNVIDVNRIAWSKPAANALKGDVYLWTGKVLNGGTADFTAALAALTASQTSTAQLLPNYNDIFNYNNKANNEVMMAVRFQANDGAFSNYWANMYVSSLSNVPASTLTMVGALGVGNTGNNIMQITKKVSDQFTTDDQRRAGTFFEIYDNSGKYVTNITTKGAGTVIGGVRNFFTDVILYRYADVLLMKAEAENALGTSPAVEINLVRQRAYGSNYSTHIFVNGTKAQNDDAILKERLLELTTEGKRWWDLVRFGQAFNLVPSLQGKDSQKFLLLFPIGQNIISQEPKVTENAGWQ